MTCARRAPSNWEPGCSCCSASRRCFFLVTQITSRRVRFRRRRLSLVAAFDQVGGLKPGAPVSMAGVTIGRVEKIEYDFDEYQARGHAADRQPLRPHPRRQRCRHLHGRSARRPVRRHRAGWIGNLTWPTASQMQFTQSAIVLENLISKFLFSKAADQGTASRWRHRDHDTPLYRSSVLHPAPAAGRRRDCGRRCVPGPAPQELIETTAAKMLKALDADREPPKSRSGQRSAPRGRDPAAAFRYRLLGAARARQALARRDARPATDASSRPSTSHCCATMVRRSPNSPPTA